MKLTHLDERGAASMVDISAKNVTVREAKAEGYISVLPETLKLIAEQGVSKGDVFAVARIAGIQGAKKTPDLIPLCHPLALSKIAVDFFIDEQASRIRIEAVCRLSGRTGVEMEALTAVSVAALTVFDMCKAVDPGMEISGIRVVSKEGGRSGHWVRS